MGSHVNAKDLLTEVRFPLPNGDSPSSSPTDRRLYEYNALGDVKKFTDPNGTVHQYTDRYKGSGANAIRIVANPAPFLHLLL